MFMMSVVAVLWRWTDADADLCHHSHRVINRRWIRGRVPKGFKSKRKTFFRAYIREEEDKRVFPESTNNFIGWTKKLTT